jgi:hypothetical protein
LPESYTTDTTEYLLLDAASGHAMTKGFSDSRPISLAENNPLLAGYHDEEWGVHDDRRWWITTAKGR